MQHSSRSPNRDKTPAAKEDSGRSRIRKIVVLSGLIFGLAACFFVGRRIYYRLIQPAPPWEHLTSRIESVVADDTLKITLWADETLVRNPTSISVDERGRVWATEAVNYRNWQNHQSDSVRAKYAAGDRIVILEDSNGDGRADRSTVFAQDEELIAPTGLCVLGDRVFVSCSPNILVFIDDDGDDKADRKEVLLTGFGGRDHDHGVHSIVPGPDGRLYFSVGNAGPHIVTDRSGWTLRSGSHYQSLTAGPDPAATPVESASTDKTARPTLNTGGLVSDDGRVYVGGLALSVLPDGTDLRVHSHNSRNPYELCVDSFGNIWQTDNDDTVGCRISWLMDGSNQGLASADGNRSWQADHRPGQSIPEAHWHQDDPGVLPAGEVYGTGAPTGLVRYEGDTFGEALDGTILACDAGLGCVFGFRPIKAGAGFRFERTKLIWSESEDANQSARNDGLSATWFRPTDVAIAADGNVFVADWYDSYVGAHRVNDPDAAGRIYLVRPANDQAAPEVGHQETGPAKDHPLSKELAAFRSASPEVRAVARGQLRQSMASTELNSAELSSADLMRALADEKNPFLKSRLMWLLEEPDFSKFESSQSQNALAASDPQFDLSVMRRLSSGKLSYEFAAGNDLVDLAPELRCQLAVSLRGQPLDETKEILLRLASTIDPKDRYELEAFGLACDGHEESIYADLRLRLGDEPANWTDRFQAIVWRLHPTAALADLKKRLQVESLGPAEVVLAVDSIAFVRTPDAKTVLEEFVSQLESKSEKSPNEMVEYVRWWVSHFDDRAGNGNRAATDRAPVEPLPVRFQPAPKIQIDSQRLAEVALKEGDPARGRSLFFSDKATCGKCHKFKSEGGRIGPDLTNSARRLDRRGLVESILFPSASILTGYETWTIVDTSGRSQSGLLISTGEEIVVRSAEGKQHAVPRNEVDELIRHGHSLMPDSLGKTLTIHEIADLVTFLREEK